jgi:hypothetical protein
MPLKSENLKPTEDSTNIRGVVFYMCLNTRNGDKLVASEQTSD